MRRLFSLLGQSTQDGATTAIYLATSPAIRENKTRGEYFIPIAKSDKTSSIAADMKLARELWVSPFCAEIFPLLSIRKSSLLTSSSI